MSRVFISYSHFDSDRVDQLRSVLEEAGISVWQDIRLPGGDAYWRVIEKEIRNAGCVIVLISSISQQSEAVRREVELARSIGKPILPISVNINPGALDSWWSHIGHIHYLNYSNCLNDVETFIENVRYLISKNAKVILSFNMKGGVGKTTLAAQVGARICKNYSKNVLFVDLDPQQNLSDMCLTAKELKGVEESFCTVLGLFEPKRLEILQRDFGLFGIDREPDPDFDPMKLTFPLGSNENKLHIIPGQFEAIKFSEATDVDRIAVRHNFETAIQKLKKRFDIILIDCNPSASLLTRCALSVANHLLVPIKPDLRCVSWLKIY